MENTVVDTACPLDCPDACTIRVTLRGGRITHQILRYANTSEPQLEPVEVRSWLTSISKELQVLLGAGTPEAAMAGAAPVGIPKPNDITLTDPFAADALRGEPGLLLDMDSPSS